MYYIFHEAITQCRMIPENQALTWYEIFFFEDLDRFLEQCHTVLYAGIMHISLYEMFDFMEIAFNQRVVS